MRMNRTMCFFLVFSFCKIFSGERRPVRISSLRPLTQRRTRPIQISSVQCLGLIPLWLKNPTCFECNQCFAMNTAMVRFHWLWSGELQSKVVRCIPCWYRSASKNAFARLSLVSPTSMRCVTKIFWSDVIACWMRLGKWLSSSGVGFEG